MIELTQDRALKKLRYDANSGLLYWRDTGKRGTGKRAGCLCTSGERWQVIVDRRAYLAHRLIWFMQTGQWPKEIDHIDGDALNNAWNNLRVATRQQNCANQRARSKTGYKGVYKSGERFIAMIKINRKTKNLGRFSTPEEAHAAYFSAAKAAFGEFARSG